MTFRVQPVTAIGQSSIASVVSGQTTVYGIVPVGATAVAVKNGTNAGTALVNALGIASFTFAASLTIGDAVSFAWTLTGATPVSTAVSSGPAGLTMTQLTAGRVYQRTSKTGGGASKGAGSIAVPVALTAAASLIEYRLRDALASGNPVVQNWTTVATNVPTSTTAVVCSGVPADAKQYLVDLRANSDNGQVALGTSPVMMGRLIAASGQSQMVRQFVLASGYAGTSASLGVSISPYCGVYGAIFDDNARSLTVPTAWAAPSTDGTAYGSTFASEFLRRQVVASGVACGLIGACQGSTYIADWAPGTANNVALRAVLDAAGGFEAFYWHQGGQDAGNNTSLATYKSALDGMFADINGHNGAWGTNYAKVLTAMATRTSSGAGTTASVQTIRQAAKQWAAANSSVYLEPHDITLADGAVHQDQPGNITLAQHAHRALLPSLGLSGNDTGPTLGTPTRASGSATVYLPVTLPSGATKLVLTGNAYTRFSVFPAGTLANPVAVSALSYDSANTRLVMTLGSVPADSQALDVYAFVHPDPSSGDYLNDMIRDDRVDGDGIAVGRSLEPSTAGPVTVAAIAAAQAPVNSAAPAISGTPQAGQTLTASQGTWSNSPTSYAYQWNRAGTAISGATSSTYVPVSADVGNALTVTVTATNATGSASSTSSATAAVTAAASPAPAVGDVILIHPFYYRTDQGSQGLGATETGWNNLDGGKYMTSSLSLVNSTGASTNLSAKLINGNMASGNYTGTSTNNNSGAVPDDVLLACAFADKSNAAGQGTSTLIDAVVSGLAAGTTWKVEMVGSRAVSSRKENMAVNGGTAISVNVGNNTGISATFTGIAPQSDGTIHAQVTIDPSESYCYLNAVRLTRTT